MKQLLEKVLPQFIVDGYKNYRNKHSSGKVIKQWELAGKPVPPPHMVKQQAIRHYQEKSGYGVLVETGTYKGDMILAQLNQFRKIYSIELSQALFEKARKRFRHQLSVVLLQGDSGEVINKILAELREPAIFWLDGHYSGGITAKTDKDSPVNEELKNLVANNQYRHLVLIDDARAFTGEGGYPTIEDLKKFVDRHFPGYHFSVSDDIIRIVPQANG